MSYWYFISNRATQQSIDLVADSPEAACREIGWRQDDCVLITVGEMVKDPKAPPGIPPHAQAASLRPKRHQLR